MMPSPHGQSSLVVAALLCAASVGAAQGWEAGAKSGINRTAITRSTEFEWSRTPTTALFFKRNIGGPFSIQPELSAVRRTGISTVSGSALTLTADYVEIPVMLNAQLFSAFGIAPYLSVGPSVAARLRCRLQFVGGGLMTDDDCDVARSSRSHRLDFGIAGGGGVGWTFSGFTLSVEARVSSGLRTYVLPIDVQNARSSSWSVLGGVSVPLYRTRRLPPVWMPPRSVMAAPSVPGVSRSEPKFVAPSREASREVVRASAGRHVTLTADDVDVREVLAAIAKITGAKVSVSSAINTRVSAVLIDVPAAEAIQAIADVAGLSVITPSIPGQATIVVRNPGKH